MEMPHGWSDCGVKEQNPFPNKQLNFGQPALSLFTDEFN
jgi:hypothetical protein